MMEVGRPVPSIVGIVGLSTLAMLSMIAIRHATLVSRRASVGRRLPAVGARPPVPAGPMSDRTPPVPPLEATMARLPSLLQAPTWFGRATQRAGVPMAPELLWPTWMISGASGVVIARLAAGVGPAILIAATVAGVPSTLLWAMRERSGDRYRADLPILLESVARSMRSGASLRMALEEGAAATGEPIADDLRSLVGDMAGGVSLADALARWEARRPLPGVRLSVAALSLGVETGGAHARAIDGVAATLRSELALAAEVRALSSQARYSALVLVAAPVVFALLASAADGSAASFLFRTPAGWACLTSGLALDGIAALWMRRLARVEL